MTKRYTNSNRRSRPGKIDYYRALAYKNLAAVTYAKLRDTDDDLSFLLVALDDKYGRIETLSPDMSYRGAFLKPNITAWCFGQGLLLKWGGEI